MHIHACLMPRARDIDPDEYLDILDEIQNEFGSYQQYEARAVELYPALDLDEVYNPLYQHLVEAYLDNWSHEYDGTFHELLVWLQYDDWEDTEHYFSSE